MKLIFTLIMMSFFWTFLNLDTKSTVLPTQLAVAPPPPLDCATPTSNVEKIVCLADAFKATLTSTQITSLQIALTTTSQAKWTNLPGGVSNRNGLEYSALSAAQLTAAKAVVEAASGTAANEGYAEFSQIRLADTYLGTVGGAGAGYSEGKYIIAFLGVPSLTGKWMLQFGGHHYAQNITFEGGKVIGITPSHQGVEPLSFTLSGTTYQPMFDERAGLLAMLSSLSTSELATAKLAATFSDVALGPGKDGQFPATQLGLSCSALTTAQKALVFAAMKPWTLDADNASGTTLQSVYESEINDTKISYSGNATLAANRDYVRIDGPSVWIELVCQSGVVFSGIHYHAIYRDQIRDYGASGYLVLPLDLLGFVAGQEDKKTTLWWSTASEVHVSHFDIERSNQPSKGFESIGKVSAKNTTSVNHYTFADIDATTEDITYYRLKIVDFDGKMKYSQVVTVKNNVVKKILVSPNPASDALTVLHPKAGKQSIIKIIAATGQIISTNTVKESATTTKLTISNLVQGFYFVVIENGIDRHVFKFFKK